MGISTDRSSAVSTALNLFSILSLPISPEELAKDVVDINRHVYELVPKLFEHYDRTQTPQSNGAPVEIQSYLVVDHIEALNEFQQSLTFHGTLILNWLDQRLAWEPQDYGHLDKLSFNGFDLGRFWSPGVIVKGITMPARQLAMFHNSVYTLMYTGHIFAEMAISVKAACRLDLGNYPKDNQTCFVMVFTPLYPSAKVTFSTTAAMMGKHSTLSNSGSQMTMASGFELDKGELEVQRFFAYSKGFTMNQSEADMYSSLTNTVLRYQIRLKRKDNGLYMATVTLPLFCMAVMAFSAIFVPSLQLSLLWLFACLTLLVMHNARMAQFLPQDYDSEPFCVRISRFLLFQFVLLLAYRLWFGYQMRRIQKDYSPAKSVDGSTLVTATEAGILPQFLKKATPDTWNSLRRIHQWVQWALLGETVVLFYRLFL